MKTRGFTVLELLIVIAVIAFIAALVFLSVQRARVQTQNSTIKQRLTELKGVQQTIKSERNQFLGYDGSAGTLEDERLVELHKVITDLNSTGFKTGTLIDAGSSGWVVTTPTVNKGAMFCLSSEANAVRRYNESYDTSEDYAGKVKDNDWNCPSSSGGFAALPSPSGGGSPPSGGSPGGGNAPPPPSDRMLVAGTSAFGGGNGVVARIEDDGSTLSEQWRQDPISGATYSFSAVGAASNAVYAGIGFAGSGVTASTPKIYQLDPASGSVIHSETLPNNTDTNVNDLALHTNSGTHVYMALSKEPPEKGIVVKYKNDIDSGTEWKHNPSFTGDANPNKITVARDTGEVFYATDNPDNNAYQIDLGNPTGAPKHTFTGSGDSVGSYDVSAIEPGEDGNTLYVAENTSGDYQVHKRDISGGSPGNEITSGWPFTVPTSEISRITLSANGNHVYVVTNNGTVYKVATSDATKVWEFDEHTDRIFETAPFGGDAVYSGGRDNTVWKIDFSSGSGEYKYDGFSGDVGAFGTTEP